MRSWSASLIFVSCAECATPRHRPELPAPSKILELAYPLPFEFVADKLQFGDNFVTHAKIGFLYDL